MCSGVPKLDWFSNADPRSGVSKARFIESQKSLYKLFSYRPAGVTVWKVFFPTFARNRRYIHAAAFHVSWEEWDILKEESALKVLVRMHKNTTLSQTQNCRRLATIIRCHRKK